MVSRLSARRGTLGQSLVEFAISSLVLVVLFGGLVDGGRMLQRIDVLKEAAREGARHGASFNAGLNSNSSLDDTHIKAAVDDILTAGGLPLSSFRNPGNCPTPSDGNSLHNPPYQGAYMPNVPNQPWLYICYNNSLSTLPASSNAYQHQDLNVILVMGYGPLSSFLPLPVAGFGLAANLHLSIQGH